MAARAKGTIAGIVCGVLAVGLGVLLIRALGIRTNSSQAAARPAAAASVTRLDASPAAVTAGFSSLRDTTVPPAPADIVGELRSIHDAPYANAKTVREGMYLTTYGSALCSWVRKGLSGCTDHLNAPDAWLMGQIERQYDSETAPFETRMYGFARDSVNGFRISTSEGKTFDAPVRHNGFDVTLRNTSFGAISAIVELYRDGRTVSLSPSDYFPGSAPQH